MISYLHHANPLAIAETFPDAPHYLSNYFLQIYLSVEEDGHVDFYCHDGKLPRYPFVCNAWVPARTLRAMGNIHSVVQAVLSSGCYFEALLDEYYIKSRFTYGKIHLPHQNLIYGFDPVLQEYLAIGFTSSGAYSSYTLSLAELDTALSDDLGASILSLVTEWEFLNDKAFSPAVVKQYLQDFVSSTNRFVAYAPPGSVYGRDVYGRVLQSFANSDGQVRDIRPWCVFHEHKQKLAGLYRYLRTFRGVDARPRLERQLKQISVDFLALRDHLVQCSLRRVHVDAAKLRVNLATITACESDAVSELAELVA